MKNENNSARSAAPAPAAVLWASASDFPLQPDDEIMCSVKQLAPSDIGLYLAAPASDIAAAPEQQQDDGWSRLALQFDGHRMQALSHLRCLLAFPNDHAHVVREFLDAPPLSGEAVLAERIAALAAPASDIAAAPEQQQDHVAPPTRGTDSQCDAAVLDLFRLTLGTLALRDWEAAQKLGAQYRAIEADAASRFRAQGGNTSDDSASAPGSATAGAAASGHDFNERGHCNRCSAYSHNAQLPCIPAEVSPPDGAMPELVDLLRNVRPNFNSAGSRTEVRAYEAIQTRIARAIELLMSAAQPAEGSAQVASVRYSQEFVTLLDKLARAKTVGTYEPVFNELIKFIDKRSAAPERSDTPVPWDSRIPEHVRQIGTASSEAAYKDAEIKEWREKFAASQAFDAAAPAGLTNAARDVLAERRRQVEQEGWSAERDDGYTAGHLSRAGGLYALYAHEPLNLMVGNPPPEWPWHRDWWKPGTARRNLIKAGALILADIERLDRARIDGDKQGAQCTYPNSITQYTGDGRPVEYCPDCGNNEPGAHDAGGAQP